MKIKNPEDMPPELIIAQLREERPLPLGRAEFDDWAERLIVGAMVPGEPAMEESLFESKKLGLAQMIMHLGPTEDHKPDAYFIKALRKGAANQIAYAFIEQKQEEKKAKQLAETLAKANAELDAQLTLCKDEQSE